MTTPMTISTNQISPNSIPEDLLKQAVPGKVGVEQANPFTRDQLNFLATWAQNQYRDIKSERNALERQWYLNLAFYMGKQNVQIISTAATANGYQLTVPNAPPWRVRLVSNKIRPIIRTELAKLTSQRPMFTVVPATTEDEDQTAARVGEAIFDSAYSSKDVHRILTDALWWTCICGTGFIKDYWDQDSIDNDSKQMGDIIVEDVTPFHLFVPDLMQKEIERQPYLIHASTRPLQWVKSRYRKTLEGKELKPDTTAQDDILEASFLNLTASKSKDREQVLILEVWIKPNGIELFPMGGMFTVIGGQVVQAKRDYPFRHGEYPFTKLEHIPTGKFYGDSVINDLVPLQREYNRTRSQIIEAKNMMAKPKLLAAKGSIRTALITSEPGQVIEYQNGMNPPTALPMQPLPNYVLEELNRIQSDMDDISGQHEITRGNTPAQVTAATAISFLQEQDDSKLSHTVSSIERAVQKVGRHFLSHVAQFWTTQRTVRITGQNMAFDAQTFTGSMLRNNTDVRVESGSALPRSKAAKQAFVMDLLKLGLVPPEKGLQMMDLGGVDRIYEDYLIDLRQTQRENIKLAMGMPLLPNTWDNHEVHIESHNKFRKGQQYENLPEETKMLFEAHVAAHQMTIGMNPAGQPLDPMMAPPVGEEEVSPPPQMGAM